MKKAKLSKMSKTKVKSEDDPPESKDDDDGLLFYMMDRHLWIFAIFLVPISLIYDVCFKIYFVINLCWNDGRKARETDWGPISNL